MSVDLYYTSISPPARACLITIRNLYLNVNLINVDLFAGEHLKDDFMKLNPLHQVPVLVDGDFVLSESRAIMCYLVNSKKPGDSLYPNDPKLRAKIDQRLYYDATVVFENNADVIRPMFEENVKIIPKEKKNNIKNYMENLELFLLEQDWFAGDNPTIADLSILSNISQIMHCGYDLSQHLNIVAWYQRCKSLPGFDENEAGAKKLGHLFKSILKEDF